MADQSKEEGGEVTPGPSTFREPAIAEKYVAVGLCLTAKTII